MSRYESSAELAADLRRFLSGEPIRARRATPLEHLVSWARRNPLPTTVAIASVLMLAVLSGVMAWMTYRNYRMMQTIQHREMRVQELRGEILYLDEVLTNSCSLASVTGETRWEQRYQQHEPKLTSALEQAIFLVPATQVELDQVNEANEQLVSLEGRAFDLVRQGKQPEAWKLLNGQDYRKHKQAYGAGLAAFAQRLTDHSERTVEAAHREAMTFLVAALCLGSLVVLILLLGIYSLVRTLRLGSVTTNE